MTARQTVSGVARISPTGPHSSVQNTAARMIATGESPVLEPYSQGSTMLLLTSSMPMIRRGGPQQHAPARIDGEREREREQRRQ